MPHRTNVPLSTVDRCEGRLMKMLLRHDLVPIPTPEEAARQLEDHKRPELTREGETSQIAQEAVRLWPVCASIPELKLVLEREHSPVYEGQLSALRSALLRLCRIVGDGGLVLEIGSTTLEAEPEGLFTDDDDDLVGVPLAACTA